MKKTLPIFFLLLSFLTASVYALDNSSSEKSNLSRGFEAYQNEDWISAIFFLRKVVETPGSSNDENLFMLIKSEIYAGEYEQALYDCDKFMKQFQFSLYYPYIQYQSGRLMHLLGKNENAILKLSDFCHQNEDNVLYPSALYWLAECFYDEYNFDSARGLYERVVNEFPDSEKAFDAQYKLDLIKRREREEKLLYLLKVTGEENLSTREDYERQLKIYETEDKIGLRKQLIDAQNRIAELELLLSANGEALEDTFELNVEPEPEVAAEEKTDGSGEGSENGSGDGDGSQQPKKKFSLSDYVKTVNESSIRVKSTAVNGKNMGAAGTQINSSRKSAVSGEEVDSIKNKARQLQYILDKQNDEEDSEELEEDVE